MGLRSDEWVQTQYRQLSSELYNRDLAIELQWNICWSSISWWRPAPLTVIHTLFCLYRGLTRYLLNENASNISNPDWRGYFLVSIPAETICGCLKYLSQTHWKEILTFKVEDLVSRFLWSVLLAGKEKITWTRILCCFVFYPLCTVRTEKWSLKKQSLNHHIYCNFVRLSISCTFICKA